MRAIIALVFVFVFSSCAFAQTTEERLQNLEKTLKKQEGTIQELKSLQKTVKKQEQTIEEQRKLIEKLSTRAQAPQPSAAPSPAATVQTASTEQVQHEVEELKEQVSSVLEAQQKKLPSEFNPAIGLVGETIFSGRRQGSTFTGSDRPGGFDVNQRSVELNIAAAVDPFAKGYAVINASADPITGEAVADVEEAAIQTTSLPCNLELKAGRFFGEFGRLGYIHDHELPFVNRPLVLDQYIGGESQTDGAQLNWLVPIGHYVSITAGVGNHFGDSPTLVATNGNSLTNGEYRPIGGLVYFGRASTSFDLTPDLSLEPGISGLINPHALDRNGVIALPNGTPETLPQYPGQHTHRTRAHPGGSGPHSELETVAKQSVPVDRLGHGSASQRQQLRRNTGKRPGRSTNTSTPMAGIRISLTSGAGSGLQGSCSKGWRTQRTAADHDCRILPVHHVGHKPLESNSPSIHSYRPQRSIRPAPG